MQMLLVVRHLVLPLREMIQSERSARFMTGTLVFVSLRTFLLFLFSLITCLFEYFLLFITISLISPLSFIRWLAYFIVF